MTSGPLEWSVHALTQSLGPHKDSWQALCDGTYGDHPMLRADFVDGLLRYFGSGREVIAIGREAGVNAAMLVLQPRGRGLWGLFKPSQAQVGCGILSDTRVLLSLFDALPGFVLGIDLLGVDPDLCRHAEGATHALRLHHALTIRIELEGGFDPYMARRPSGLRQNLRRYERRAESDGHPVRHVVISEPDLMGEAVARYCALESAGWKGAAGTALALDNAQGAFYGEQMARATEAGQAEVHELWLGDHLAASRLVVHSRRFVVMLKTTYDESRSKYAPGRVLLGHVIEYYFRAHSGASIEFYTDATRDQLAWDTHRRSIVNIRIYRNALVESVMLAARTLQHSLYRSRGHASEGKTEVTIDTPCEAKILDDGVSSQGVQASRSWFDLIHREVFASKPDATVLTLRQGDQAVAALPVLVDHAGGMISGLSNYYTALYAPYIAPWLKTSDLRPLLDEARRRWPRAHRWTFGPMDPASQSFMLLRAALMDAGLTTFTFFRFANWQLPCAGLRWEDYLQARPGALRSTIGRMGRRFAAQGGRLELIMGGERLDAGIAAFEQVYASSWKQAEPYPAFIRNFMRASAEQGWLRLAVAWLGDEPVAAQCWTVCHGRAEIFKLAYAGRFKAVSAGTLLTALLMRRVLDEDQVQVVDYLAGDEPYKRDWMSERHERWAIVAYEPANWRGWAGLGREAAGRILKSFRAHPVSEVRP